MVKKSCTKAQTSGSTELRITTDRDLCAHADTMNIPTATGGSSTGDQQGIATRSARQINRVYLTNKQPAKRRKIGRPRIVSDIGTGSDTLQQDHPRRQVDPAADLQNHNTASARNARKLRKAICKRKKQTRLAGSASSSSRTQISPMNSTLWNYFILGSYCIPLTFCIFLCNPGRKKAKPCDKWDIVSCPSCNALLWNAEAIRGQTSNGQKQFSLCCQRGRVRLPPVREPPSPLHDKLYGFDLNVNVVGDVVKRVYDHFGEIFTTSDDGRFAELLNKSR
ncbi:hypothetical protein YC2023_083113 [Brassica napus]